MTLPMPNYDELLDQVRELTNESKLLEDQLSTNFIKTTVDPPDVNHNLALLQKDNNKGSEIVKNETLQIPGPSLESSQIFSSSKSLNSIPILQTPIENSTDGIRIPPGDLTSRLTVWRNKNRHLLTPERQEQRLQQRNSSGETWTSSGLSGINGLNSTERRRPLSVHGSGPREDLLFGTLNYPNLSIGLGRSHSVNKSNGESQTPDDLQLPPAPPPIISADRLVIPPPAPRLNIKLEPDIQPNAVTSSESHAKSTQSYDIVNGINNEEDMHSTRGMPSSTSIDWTLKSQDMWNSTQLAAGQTVPQLASPAHNELLSMMSFSSGSGAKPATIHGQRRLNSKMDVVNNLLSMLGSTEGREDMSATLLSMSNSVESCLIMRQSGCLPLLIQLIHAPGQDPETRERACRALYNIVHAKMDEKSNKREARVLRLLEQLRDYCQMLRNTFDGSVSQQDLDNHPGAAIAALMKLSFDESHRFAMCQLGGLHAVAELIEMDHSAHGTDSAHQNCINLRRYSGMALTNLTFGDSNNKALLCSFQQFMKALVSQLRSPSDDLRQVTASVLRNLSWKADSSSRQTLREVGTVVALMRAAMEGRKESTLKSILSALWNLSAHCSTNKIDICAVDGALAFLVDMLSYNAPSKTLSIVENAGGILRNVSSHVAVRDDYRAIIRERGCLQVLLRQLRSPSLTVVSNACGTLWNLSARCPQDQKLLWDLGAVPMLRSLIHSKHKMISMGSSAALKNLLSACPSGSNVVQLDSTARGLGLSALPSLMARRQKALEQEIDQSLSETCDNIEPSNSPIHKEEKFTLKLDQHLLDKSNKAFQQSLPGNQQPGSSGVKYTPFPRSESRDSMRSVTSTHSDTVFEKVNRQMRNGMIPVDSQLNQVESISMHSEDNSDGTASVDGRSRGRTEKKYTLRYMNVIPERLKPGEPLPDLRGINSNSSTIAWATPFNPDTIYPKSALNSSIDDDLSSTNSCESSNTKGVSKVEPNSRIPMIPKPKIASPYTLPLKNNKKAVATGNITNNIKYPDQTSDDDKHSSAYSTGTELDQDSMKADGSRLTAPLNASRIPSVSKNVSNESRRIPVSKGAGKRLKRETKSNNDVITKSELPRSASCETAKSSIGSDSAVFDLDHKIDESSGAPSLSSLEDDTSSTLKSSKSTKVSNTSFVEEMKIFTEALEKQQCFQKNFQKNGYMHTFKNDSQKEDSSTENNLVRYQTNISLNDIEIEDIDVEYNDKTQSTNTLQNFGLAQYDDDKSEFTKSNNDYYTVQETYTLEKNVNDTDDEDNSLCESLTYVSIDEKDSNFDTAKSKIDSGTLSDNMVTADAWSSEKCVPSMSAETKNFQLKQSDEINKQGAVVPKEKSEEEYRRQRDPDAMIASLDRLTAALVQQSEAIRGKDNTNSASITTVPPGLQQSELMRGKDLTGAASLSSTDCISWNDSESSFSISASAPLVASFKSEVSDPVSGSMTDSKIIEREAFKLAEAVSATGDVSDRQSAGDKMKVKSQLPVGLLARRAIRNASQNRASSIENLLNECTGSRIDNVNPPSFMDELLDLSADLENSLLSVASIADEVVDSAKTPSCTENVPEFGCLDEINPPSLLNEVSNFEDSSLMHQSHDDTDATLCEGTLDENVDEDDGAGNTPLSSDVYSSNESTPKKGLVEKCQLLKKRFTPKQKRQLAKERFKTYTIAQESLESQEPQKEATEIPAMEEWQQPSYTRMSPKLTPRQRRQGDRARFETKVLSAPSTPNKSSLPTPTFSGIPLPRKTSEPVDPPKQQNEESQSSRSPSESSDSEDSDDQAVPKGPRIVKPGTKREVEAEPVTPEPEPKGIRGRRKPLYSSVRRPQPPPPPAPVSRSNSSPLVRQTRTLALRQSNALQKSRSQSSHQTQSQKKTSQTQMRSPQHVGSPLRTAATSLQRQGTFTKEEPHSRVTKVAQSSSAQSSRIPSPRNSAPSTPTGGPSAAKQLSAFEQSGIPRRLSLGLRPGNNCSTTPGSTISRANSAAIKETTSKIASLWRKVESHTKQQQQNARNDTRQWITGVNRAATFATFNKRSQQAPRELFVANSSNLRTNL